MNNYSEPKELFFAYDGLFFHMDREGEYAKFKKINVPDSLLKEWRIEIAQKYIREIETDRNTPKGLERLSHCFDVDSSIDQIDDLLNAVESVYPNYCTFGKIRAAESLIDLSSKRIGKEGKAKTLSLCRRIISSIPEDLKVCSHYWSISYLRDVLTKDSLKERVEGILARLSIYS